ncbi:hypothetical protein GCM10023169_22250 [Georgenia halophila]|uniref:Site-specific recombinase XerD n=1 Tax=Georgenia halophila TaxID=620889 RepID=A0ABP8L8U1_9MICO
MPIDVNPRGIVQGRPRTTGDHRCDRCGRDAAKIRTRWPEGAICGICFHHAMRTRGSCASCGEERLLPGIDGDRSPICAPCAGIPASRCAHCGEGGENYRRGTCARCALRADLRALLVEPAVDTAMMERVVDVLAAADRRESVLAWMRPQEVKDLLHRIATNATPMSHAGLDAEPHSLRVEHLRSILETHGFLDPRDHHLAQFERWLDARLALVDDPALRHPVERFARWHHLARIRARSEPGRRSRGSVHASKQQVTETLKFLTWLRDTHGRDLDACTQQDVDQYLAEGPTTRHLIRTFFVWSRKTSLERGITIGHRTARTAPHLTQDERLAWIRELVTGTAESLPYRVAGVLLLLYAQPLVRVAELKLSNTVLTPDGIAIRFTDTPIAVPKPFAGMLAQHLSARPNQRGANRDSDWLFPSTRAGRHVTSQTIMDRLRDLGINLRGARNRAMRDLVSEIPAPVVASLLGYSDQVTQRHAQAAATPMAQYAALQRASQRGSG